MSRYRRLAQQLRDRPNVTRKQVMLSLMAELTGETEEHLASVWPPGQLAGENDELSALEAEREKERMRPALPMMGMVADLLTHMPAAKRQADESWQDWDTRMNRMLTEAMAKGEP